MYYINTETQAFPVSEFDIKQEYPDTSFPTPFVAPAPYAPVVPQAQPDYDPIYQGVELGTPSLVDGTYYETWNVYQLPAKQVAENEARARNNNQNFASQLLSATDWTAISSIADPLECNPYLGNRPAFLEYRNAVRQIALNPPVTVTSWPVKPQEEWIAVQ